jgi:threonine/homoserine/homoserine lactone efflux protein
MIAFLIQGLSLGLSGAASPGPFQVYLFGQTMRIGWRKALPAVIAPVISDIPVVLLVFLALTHLPDFVLRIVQLLGGGFVLYLAWKSYLTWKNFREMEVPLGEESRQSIFQAVLMNFLSPNPFIFWSLLAGPVFGAARQFGAKVNRVMIGVSALALAGFGIYQLWQGIFA